MWKVMVLSDKSGGLSLLDKGKIGKKAESCYLHVLRALSFVIKVQGGPLSELVSTQK